MTAYDKIRLHNLIICKQAKRFARLGLINESELSAIVVTKQPAYHRTNIFIRIGVLLLTVILTFCSYGLAIMLFDLNSDWGFKIALLFFSITTFAALEFFIKSKNHFASGIDDGLTWFGLACISGFLGLIIEPGSAASMLIFFTLLFATSLAASVRYTDRLVVLVCYASFLLTIFYAVVLLAEISKLIMPFVMGIISGCAYLIVTKQEQKYELRFWHHCFEMLQYASLLSIYASCNYFVVREASRDFFNMQLLPGEDIPLSTFFYLFTISVPLIYVYLGLKKKDIILLNCGLILIVAAIATIRYYYSLMPIEMALLLGGIILLAIAWFVYYFLKTPRSGFNIEEDKTEPAWFGEDVQSLLMAQALAQQATAPKNDNAEFGSGKFGGGGAGESF